MGSWTGTITLVESYGHLLAWGLLLVWASLTTGIRVASQPTPIMLGADLPSAAITEQVDLCRDPVGRLVLITGIGEVTAGRIVAGRRGDEGFSCLCQILRLPGVPDGPLLEAGPWLKPRPCLPGSCRSRLPDGTSVRRKR